MGGGSIPSSHLHPSVHSLVSADRPHSQSFSDREVWTVHCTADVGIIGWVRGGGGGSSARSGPQLFQRGLMVEAPQHIDLRLTTRDDHCKVCIMDIHFGRSAAHPQATTRLQHCLSHWLGQGSPFSSPHIPQNFRDFPPPSPPLPRE